MILDARLLTLTTLEHVASALLITFEHDILTLHLRLGHRLPVLGIQLAGRHEGDLVGLEFALLETLNETCVADVGSWVEIRQTATRDHLVDLGEVGIFPVLANSLAIGFLNRSIIHSLFEIDSLIWIEGLIEMFVDEGGDMGSERHLVGFAS